MRKLLILVLLCAPCLGQSWSNIVATSRAVDWTKAGLPGTITYGTGGSACNGSSVNCTETITNPWTPPVRTQCGSTISAGASPSTINTALSACKPGTYVLLGPGTFNFTSSPNCFGNSVVCIQMYAVNGVTLRGSGPQSTIINMGTSGVPADIAFGIVNGDEYCSWTGGLSAGSTSLTLSGCNTAPQVGDQLFLTQCDTGWTGSITGNLLECNTGGPSDNGNVYVCANTVCSNQSQSLTFNNHQFQNVLVTAVSGSGTYTVTVTPAIYMTNWTTALDATAEWTATLAGNLTPIGDAVEDMTIVTPSSTGSQQNWSISVDHTYASWVKGVRFLGANETGSGPLGFYYCGHCLGMNNYLFSDLVLDNNFPVPIQRGNSSDTLLINNIMASGVAFEGNGGEVGNVLAFNYGRDILSSGYQATVFNHHGDAQFDLWEGNQFGVQLEDYTWGTHNLGTMFRSWVSTWDPVYQSVSQTARGIQVDPRQRFMNFIGNAIGTGASTPTVPVTVYQSTATGGSNFIFDFSSADSMTLASSFRWGNCDTVTNTCRNQSSEVPSTITPNTYCTGSTTPFSCCTGSGTGTCSATAYQNSVPGTNNLPCSFFLSSYTSTTCTPSYTGGTGLSFWKVCKTWNTFPTSCATTQTQPFPPVGPDLTGGSYVNGTAYDVPAAIAFANLPIDTTYQNSYSITGSSWSGGVETLTVSGLPNPSNHIMGPMQISGGACGTGSGEVYITASNSTTVSYALASNPGSCSGANMLFPDVRQFDERVYQNDPSGVTPPTAPASVILAGNAIIQGQVTTK